MQIKYPLILILILAVSSVSLVAGNQWRKKNQKVYFIPHLAFINQYIKSLTSVNNKKIITKINWFFCILFILVLSILTARPQKSLDLTDPKIGIDVVLVLDGSGSMFIDDIKPTRLDASRSVIKDFVSRLKTDRVSLVVFSETAHTLCPLTFDYAIINYYLDLMNEDNLYLFVSGGLTAIGDGIVLGSEKFEKDTERTKVMILLTDGDSNTGIDTIIAAKYANDDDIKIYTIFVGDSTYTSPQQSLQEIADITEGKSYIADDKASLEQIFTDIETLEKTKIEHNKNIIKKDNPNSLLIGASIIWILYLVSYYLLNNKK